LRLPWSRSTHIRGLFNLMSTAKEAPGDGFPGKIGAGLPLGLPQKNANVVCNVCQSLLQPMIQLVDSSASK